MVCPSKPSPAGSGRRLSDLLAERQEPFLLDLYLIEKGHHESLPTPLCWTTKRLTRKHGLGRRGTFQHLKCMLTRFLHGKALNWGREKVVLPLQDIPVSVDESKQLSPVSVLDLHSSGDDSPAHLNSNAQEINDFNVFQELLELACCPTSTNPAANSGKQFDEAEEKDDKSITHCHGSLAHEIADETLDLTSTEMSNTKRKWLMFVDGVVEEHYEETVGMCKRTEPKISSYRPPLFSGKSWLSVLGLLQTPLDTDPSELV